MAEGFPDRMKPDYKGAIELLYENKRLGQKNGVGFYKYEMDKRGKPKKVADEATYELLKITTDSEKQTFEDQAIIDRTMLAFCNETVRCLEDNIVSTPSEADMAMIMVLVSRHSAADLAVISTKWVWITTWHCVKNTHTLAKLMKPRKRFAIWQQQARPFTQLRNRQSLLG